MRVSKTHVISGSLTPHEVSTLMGFIHPVFQACATLFGIYVLWLGWARFQALHLNKRVPFQWKLHVRLGTVVLAVWALGALAGLGMAHIVFGYSFVSGTHAAVGMLTLPFIAFSLYSGHRLDTVKMRRTWLPLAHGINNVILIGLCLWQVRTGYTLMQLLL